MTQVVDGYTDLMEDYPEVKTLSPAPIAIIAMIVIIASIPSSFALGSVSIALPATTSVPLRLFKEGVPVEDIVCKEGFQLVIKAEDSSTACVKPDTAQILLERDWAKEILQTIGNTTCIPKDSSQINSGFNYSLPQRIPTGYSLQGIDVSGTGGAVLFFYVDHPVCIHPTFGVHGNYFFVSMRKELNIVGHAILSSNGTEIGFNQTVLPPLTSLEFQQDFLKTEIKLEHKTTDMPVDVNSYKGLLSSSGVMFLNDNDQVLYGIGGNLTAEQLLDIARSIPP